MNKLEKLLSSDKGVVLDGAMGTMLMAAGLVSGAPPEEWNVIYPERIRDVHRHYIDAGAQIILTNSFGGTRYRLKLHQFQDRVYELNKAAARVARAEADASPHLVLVAGSMGPTGELLEPMGSMTFDAASAAFAEQTRGLVDGGVDLLWIETMSDTEEVRAAVEGIRSVTDLPICATMSFDTNGRTMMGVTPMQAVQTLSQWGLAGVGGNCGNGIDEIERVIFEMHQAAPDVRLIAKSNAGIPQWRGDELVYDTTPDTMGDYAQRVRTLGASFVGGCCGNTPEHVHAIAQSLNVPLEEAEQQELIAAFKAWELESGTQSSAPARTRTRRRNRD